MSLKGSCCFLLLQLLQLWCGELDHEEVSGKGKKWKSSEAVCLFLLPNPDLLFDIKLFAKHFSTLFAG